MVCKAAGSRSAPRPDLGLFGRSCHSRIGSMPLDLPRRRKLSHQGLLPVLAWFAFLFAFAVSAVAEIPDWDNAVRPLDEGVPQVAVMRLREILKRELAPADRKMVLTKLGE